MGRKRFALYIDYTESVYAQRIIKGALNFFDTKDVEFLVFSCGLINSQSPFFGYQRLAIASLINENNIDGIIFICGPQETTSTSEQIHSYLKFFTNIPIICIGHDYPDYPCIVNSSTESIIELTEHIIKKHKCKHPAIFIPKSPSLDILQRINTIYSTFDNYNISISKENIITCAQLSYDNAIDGLKEYKKKIGKFNFDSLICITDSLAFASIDYLTSCGIKIPNEILITGFDDENDTILYSPTLTSINQNVEKQAFYASKILYKMVLKEKQFTDTITIHSSVFYRKSCGCIPLNSDRFKYLDSKNKLRSVKPENQGFFEYSQWSHNRLSVIKAVQLYSTLENDILINELSERIESDLTKFYIKKVAVVLFNEPISTDKFEFFPLPSKAYVLSSYDIDANLHYNIKLGKTIFNPKEQIIPNGYISSLHKINIISIYSNSILYGYFLFEPNNLDQAIYGILSKMLSSIISRASYSYETLKKKKQLEIENNKIKLVSVTDDMTGLLNRRGFISNGIEAIKNSTANGKKGLILFGDMDGLKKINDNFGHAAGDKAIKAEAKILKNLFRSSDIIGRLGGDEFAIIAPDMSVEKFKKIKRILQEKCQEYNKNSNEKFSLSISMGFTEYGLEEQEDLEKLLTIADNELYKEKQLKYNKIVTQEL